MHFIKCVGSTALSSWVRSKCQAGQFHGRSIKSPSCKMVHIILLCQWNHPLIVRAAILTRCALSWNPNLVLQANISWNDSKDEYKTSLIAFELQDIDRRIDVFCFHLLPIDLLGIDFIFITVVLISRWSALCWPRRLVRLVSHTPSTSHLYIPSSEWTSPPPPLHHNQSLISYSPFNNTVWMTVNLHGPPISHTRPRLWNKILTSATTHINHKQLSINNYI